MTENVNVTLNRENVDEDLQTEPEATNVFDDPKQNDLKSGIGPDRLDWRTTNSSTGFHASAAGNNNENNLDPAWAYLSSEILVHILSFLPRNEQLSATSVCKTWRTSFFHLNCWQTAILGLWPLHSEIVFHEKLTFYERCLNRARFVTFNFAADSQECVRALIKLLEKASNGRLLTLEFHQLLWKTPDFDSHPEWEKTAFDFVSLLAQIAQQNPYLEKLDFGFWNILSKSVTGPYSGSRSTSYFRKFAALIPEMLNLKSLNMAADFDIPIPFEPCRNPFAPFRNVKVLSLNVLDITPELFDVFCTVESSLGLIVIAFCPDPSFSNQFLFWNEPELWQSSWQRFFEINRDCNIALVIYNSPISLNAELFSRFYCPWMRVSMIAFLNLKTGVGDESLRCFTTWGKSLQTVIVAYTNTKRKLYLSNRIGSQGSLHSLVGCAWYCKNLRSLVIYGYNESADNLVGIARLAGPRLDNFSICKSSILKASQFPRYSEEVSKALNRPWKPCNERSAKWDMFKKPPDELPGAIIRHFMDEVSQPDDVFL